MLRDRLVDALHRVYEIETYARTEESVPSQIILSELRDLRTDLLGVYSQLEVVEKEAVRHDDIFWVKAIVKWGAGVASALLIAWLTWKITRTGS